MAKRRERLTLGGRIERRRKQLGLSQAEAHRRTGVSRGTWRSWESDASVPDDRNHRIIEGFCGWESGSVAEVLAGRLPRLLREATVTQLHPDRVPQDDEFVAELRTILKDGPVLDGLIGAYWAEKAGVQRRYLEFAREARAPE